MMEENAPVQNNTNSKRSPVRSMLSFRKIIASIVVPLIVAVSSIYVMLVANSIAIAANNIMETANSIANTANILQLDNAVKIRMDDVSSIQIAFDELKSNPVLENYDKAEDILYQKEKTAIKALLNIFELACELYIGENIDKKIFKSYYSELIKYYADEYGVYIKPDTYSAIKMVNEDMR